MRFEDIVGCILSHRHNAVSQTVREIPENLGLITNRLQMQAKSHSGADQTRSRVRHGPSDTGSSQSHQQTNDDNRTYDVHSDQA